MEEMSKTPAYVKKAASGGQPCCESWSPIEEHGGVLPWSVAVGEAP